MPIDTSPPPTMFGHEMVAEGVETFETRNLVQLGEAIERRIRTGFGEDPERPVALKASVPVGYPLDALLQGIEGRVLVWFVVDAEGVIVEREVIDGPTELADWTLRRLDRLVDRPAFRENQPVRAWVALEVVFSREAVGGGVGNRSPSAGTAGRPAFGASR